MYIADNYDRFAAHEAEQERLLDKLPRCCECDEPILDDYLYEINGEYICEHCLKEYYRKSVDSVMGW